MSQSSSWQRKEEEEKNQIKFGNHRIICGIQRNSLSIEKKKKKQDRSEQAFSLCLSVRWPRWTLIIPEVPAWVHSGGISASSKCRKMLNDAENIGSVAALLATSKTVTQQRSQSKRAKHMKEANGSSVRRCIPRIYLSDVGGRAINKHFLLICKSQWEHLRWRAK